jgi:signal peptidase I
MNGDTDLQQTQPAEAPRTTRAWLHNFWREWRGFIIFLLVMFSFRSAIADWNDVPSGSMLPTILIGDRILVDKLAYDLKVPFTTVHLSTWGAPKRGDIIVFYSPSDGTRLVKRVIGVPGDEIAMLDNQLVINGRPLHYASRETAAAPSPGADSGAMQDQELKLEDLDGKVHRMQLMPNRPSPISSFAPTRVPADEFWVMGDNRDNSNDSRFIGFVRRGDILGRASRVVMSLDPDHWYAPRRGRFFTSLD